MAALSAQISLAVREQADAADEQATYKQHRSACTITAKVIAVPAGLGVPLVLAQAYFVTAICVSEALTRRSLKLSQTHC